MWIQRKKFIFDWFVFLLKISQQIYLSIKCSSSETSEDDDTINGGGDTIEGSLNVAFIAFFSSWKFRNTKISSKSIKESDTIFF